MSYLPSDRPVLMIEAHRGEGGPPNTLLRMATALARRRPVTVAIPPGRIAEEIQETAPQVVVHLLPPWSATERYLLRLQTMQVIQRLVDEGVIIHANGKSALNLVAPALTCRKRKPPILVHFHDSELTPKTARILRTWPRFGVRADYAPVSDHAASVLYSHGIGPVIGKLPNPISRVATTAKLGGPPYRFAFVTSRQRNKGLDLMVEVASRLRDFPCTWDVYGLGSFPETDSFADRCHQRIRNLGLDETIAWKGKQRGLPHLLSNYHALLITSRQESFCRVAVEGMAAGLPVVAGAVAGLTETVGIRNCCLFDLDELDEAAKALRRVVTDPDLFADMQNAGLARAAEFEPERVCDRLEVLYASLVSSAKPG